MMLINFAIVMAILILAAGGSFLIRFGYDILAGNLDDEISRLSRQIVGEQAHE